MVGDRTKQTPRKILTIVFTTILIDFIGFSVLFPVLPIYADKFGATAFQVGVMLTLYALVQLIFLPVWGWISDRIGRRPVLLISLFGTACSFLLLAAVNTIGEIYIARAISGFFAATIGTAQAIVTDSTDKKDRTSGMGLIGAAFGIGMIVGPLLGGVLAQLEPRLPFIAVSILATLNFSVACIYLPESRTTDKPRGNINDLLKVFLPTPLRLITSGIDRRLRLFLYLFLHVFTAFAVLESMITLYLSYRFGANEWQAGLFFGWIGFWLSITQGVLLRRLTHYLDDLTLTLIGVGIMALTITAIPFLPTVAWFFLIGPLLAFGNGIAFPSFTSLFSKACLEEKAGELLGQSQSMATTGRIIAPLGAGYLMHNIGLGIPFIVAGALMALGALLIVSFRVKLIQGQRITGGTPV